MANETYEATKEATIYKETKLKTKVTVVKKGTKLSIQSSMNKGNILKIAASNQKKINNKDVRNCYVEGKYFKKKAKSSSGSSSSSGNGKDIGIKSSSNSHSKHADMLDLKGTASINAYIRSSCSSTKSTGIFIAKGTKVTVHQYCSSNAMYKVTGKGSDGRSHTTWVPVSAVSVKASTAKAKAAALKKKLKDAKKKGTEKIKKTLAGLKANTKKHAKNQANRIVSDLYSIGSVNINTAAYAEKLIIQNSQGIHGIPYQFLPSVDYRITEKVSFGRKYVERIVMKMPLVLFTPGIPDFAASFNKQEKKNILQALISSVAGTKKINNSVLSKIIKNEGRYYTFVPEYKGYYQYVNKMLRYCSVMLGVGNVTHTTIGFSDSQGFGHGNWGKNKAWPGNKIKLKGKKAKLKNFQWYNMVNSRLKGFFCAQEYVAFYVDSETSISESFDNTTAPSSLDSGVNQGRELSREIQFLAGPVAGLDISNMVDEESFDDAEKKAHDIADRYLKGSKLVKRLAEMFNTIKRGGKVVFPELWDSSSYTKSYSLSIKLRTPDGDKLSWYFNILVPLIHLLALAAPHALGANGFSSPYLVRAWYKGIFNVDMGIITNIDITKGKDSAWTVDGLPTEVDVQISIKDLYQFFAISGGKIEGESFKSKIKKDPKFFSNTALLDYLCNTCGININKIEVARQLEAYSAFATNKFIDFFPGIWQGFNQGMSKKVGQIYSSIVKPGYN